MKRIETETKTFLKRCKPNRTKLIDALGRCLLLLIVSPVLALVITFLSPSVSEVVNPNLGECNITYKGEYQPCITYLEAFKINWYIMIGVSIIGFFIFLLYPDELIKRKEVMKNE